MPLQTLYYGQGAPYQPPFADPGQVAEVVEQMRGMGFLVQPSIADLVRAELAAGTFFVQGGDCVSIFSHDTRSRIGRQVQCINGMATIISGRTGRPVRKELRTGPAKPRTDTHEMVEGHRVLTFRGPAVHGIHHLDREPDPKLMLEAYSHAEAVHDHLAELGLDVTTAREAQLLPMEFGMADDESSRTAARLWIGLRTIGDAHLRFAKRLRRTPWAVKIGPGVTKPQIRWICEELSEGIPGRLTLVTRFGAGNVLGNLPELLEEALATGVPFGVHADLVHGNTRKVKLGGKVYKYRIVEDAADEFDEVHLVCSRLGIPVTGVWVESTGDPVTECLSRNQPLSDLLLNYQALVDPRFTLEQCEILAHRIADRLLAA